MGRRPAARTSPALAARPSGSSIAPWASIRAEGYRGTRARHPRPAPASLGQAAGVGHRGRVDTGPAKPKSGRYRVRSAWRLEGHAGRRTTRGQDVLVQAPRFPVPAACPRDRHPCHNRAPAARCGPQRRDRTSATAVRCRAAGTRTDLPRAGDRTTSRTRRCPACPCKTSRIAVPSTRRVRTSRSSRIQSSVGLRPDSSAENSILYAIAPQRSRPMASPRGSIRAPSPPTERGASGAESG